MNYTALFGFLLFALFSCQPAPPEQNLDLEEELADFESFYYRFHTDKDFQMNHIPFPIKGVPDNAINKPDFNENFIWTADNWVMNQPIDLEGTQFKREIQSLGDELIIERLIHESGSYGMVRRFAKMDGEWMLIYFQGVNPL